MHNKIRITMSQSWKYIHVQEKSTKINGDNKKLGNNTLDLKWMGNTTLNK